MTGPPSRLLRAPLPRPRRTKTTMTMPSALLALIAFATATSAFIQDGPAASLRGCPSQCSCSQWEISCVDLGLREVPEDLPEDKLYTKIDLSLNQISRIPGRLFRALPNLEELSLSDNGLSEVSIDGLESGDAAPKIKTLNLNNNAFLTLPEAFLRHFPTLERLYIKHNILTVMAENSLDFLTRLRELNLAKNVVSLIQPHAFRGLTNLEQLNLRSNQLVNVSKAVFTHTPRLRSLDLSINNLAFVPTTALREAPQLDTLLLGRNRISALPEDVFQGLNNAEEIDIRGNPIKSVHVNAFRHLPRLKQLILSEAREVSEFPNLNGTVSLEKLRLDRASIERIPDNLCHFTPRLKSLELKSNQLTGLPDLSRCRNLRLVDFGHNELRSLDVAGSNESVFRELGQLHDILLSHNNITEINEFAFDGVGNLQILDLSNNKIEFIHDAAFKGLDKIEDINLGVNHFPKFPSEGLSSLLHIKTHNNPKLEDFPGPTRFPNVQSLTLSYAYHCCQFLPSTYENQLPDYSDITSLQEKVFFPGEGAFDHNFLHENSSDIWAVGNSSGPSTDLWANLNADFTPDLYDSLLFSTPRPGIECSPTPGPFLPCNDLFDWWTLRCSVWIVFLLALLGNGCVVIVLVASRSKMDVPRFLVCNLAAADFFMGLYLGFLAFVDAGTMGEFRKFALGWQFSVGCQLAGFFGVLSSELSVFTLAVITLERNYAITHAMHLNKRLSLKNATYIMIAGWVFALLMAALPLIGISDYRKFAVCLPFETGDGLSKAYVITLMLLNGVAFSILMGCYLKMYCAIRGSQAWNSNDSRIAKRMALLVFSDFLCWFPIAFLSLAACGGLHLISLEGAKVFTIFVLPLNSCCNPFLYAILTKQFKKDCVMICKTIEESRVTRGIGRCRHSSNFSNRQTPANTNSLNSGSGTHSHSKGTVCSCNIKKPQSPGARLTSAWPFRRLKHLFHEYRDGGLPAGIGSRGTDGSRDRGLDGSANSSSYAAQIAEIQHKQGKGHHHHHHHHHHHTRGKRHASVSSDNFSSSRSDSWRQHGACLPGLRFPGAAQRHRRRASWTVTRKPSQDSQMSSSRDSASSNSTNTWRMSRSSVSSDANNSSVVRSGSGYGRTEAAAGATGTTGATGATGATSGKYSALAQRTQAARILKQSAGNGAGAGAMAVDKPKLTRQTAILADGDSTSSGKSVTFQDAPPPVRSLAPGGGAAAAAAATAAGVTCPVHSAEYMAAITQKYRSLYNKLIESNQEDEESDMEASDAEDEPREESDHLPLGTTYRTVAAVAAAAAAAQPIQPKNMLPRKLSTKEEEDEEDAEDAVVSERNVLQSAEAEVRLHIEQTLREADERLRAGKRAQEEDSHRGTHSVTIEARPSDVSAVNNPESSQLKEEDSSPSATATPAAAAEAALPVSEAADSEDPASERHSLLGAVKKTEDEVLKKKKKKPYLNTDV